MFNSPYETLNEDSHFAEREVGLTHPDVPGYIRLRSNGDIEIVADEGLAIVLNPKSRSITFFADHIKFFTKDSGLRWNQVQFNNQAVAFHEPTFIPIDERREATGMYNDVDYFIDPPLPQKEKTLQEKVRDKIKSKTTQQIPQKERIRREAGD